MKKILILLHLFVPFVCIAQITVADYSYRENLSSSQLASSYKATGFIRQFDYTKDLSFNNTLFSGERFYTFGWSSKCLKLNGNRLSSIEQMKFPSGYYTVDEIYLFREGAQEIKQILKQKVYSLELLKRYGSESCNITDLGFAYSFNSVFQFPSTREEFIERCKMRRSTPPYDLRDDYIAYVVISEEKDPAIKYFISGVDFKPNEIPTRTFDYIKKELLDKTIIFTPESAFVDNLTQETIDVSRGSYKCVDIIAYKPSGRYDRPLFAVLEGNNVKFAVNIREVSNEFGVSTYSGINCTFLTETANRIKNSGREKEKQEWEAYLKAQQESERKSLVSKYGSEFGELILRKEIAIGMNKEMVRAAWYSPLSQTSSVNSSGTMDIWVYDLGTYVTFVNGIVSSITTTK